MSEQPSSYLSPKLQARRTSNGHGVFAQQSLKKGELLVVFGGVICDFDTFMNLSKNDQILQNPSPNKVRVVGIIQGGSLIKTDDKNRAFFLLQGNDKTLPVRYHGQDTDTLRDLKVVVITGRFYAGTGEFEGEAVSLIPNYGFVAAAYILGIIPALLFLFLMERKLRLLYMEVKEARLYEPEVMDFDKE